jgi:hypothetical protein
MIVFGHVGGFPVEEMLCMAPVAGTFLVALRARFGRRVG